MERKRDVFKRKKDPEAVYFEDLERRKKAVRSPEAVPEEPDASERPKKRKKRPEKRGSVLADILEVAVETVIELLLDALD